ncbi:DNA primase [Bacteroidia bacterium]|nr:DNA primase [Bacteroidia bacterium]
MIDKATIDRIYESANIVDVVQDYVDLKKHGANYTACCPFHDEKSPSFSVSPARNIFKCFGCGKAGNAVTFVMEHEKLGYADALKLLAKKYGIAIQERELSPEESQQNDDRESMMVVSAFAQTYFTKTLHEHADGKNIGLSYFAERGITMPSIQKFQLGYCLDQRNAFAQAALLAGYKKDFLVQTGLCIARDNGELFDRFAGRAMFPIHSISGRVIAFGGRTLKSDKSVAKYLNSPESPVYHKSNVLYGIFQAKKSIVQHDKCFLVEGYTDVISMHQSGIENVVASSGTSLTTEQIKLIQRFTPNVTVLYDGDAAGIKASLRGIDMLLAEGMNVKTLLLPDGEDPDSFARAHSATELEAYIASHEEDFIAFKTKTLLRDAGGDPVKKAGCISDIVQSISLIGDNIIRAVYIGECSKLLQIEENVLTQEVAKLRRKRYYGEKDAALVSDNSFQNVDNQQLANATSITETHRFLEQEKELIYFLLKFGHCQLEEKSVADFIIEGLQTDRLTLQHPQYQQTLEEYQRLQALQEGVSIDDFLHHPNQNICQLTANMLSQKYTSSSIWEKRNAQPVSEEGQLQIAVPKALLAYKIKIFEQSIRTKTKELEQSELDESELDNSLLSMEDIQRLSALRKEYAERLNRVVP